MAPSVVLLTGPPGSGKSTLARQLAPLLGARHLPIDRYRAMHGRDAWRELVADARHLPLPLIESVVTPPGVMRLVADRPHVHLAARCAEPVRRARLHARGHREWGSPYRPTLPAHAAVDLTTGTDPARIAAYIRTRLRLSSGT